MTAEASEEEKKAQYDKFVQQLKKDMGLDKLIETVDKILAFEKPDTEKQMGPIEKKVSAEDKKKLMDADDAIEFLDKLGNILQKYNIIEGQPSDPYLKMMQTFAMNHIDLLQWQARENFKQWENFKRDQDRHRT